MDSENHLSKEVCDWFDSIGTECRAISAPDEVFDSLDVRREGRTSIIVKLISLNNWQQSPSAAQELANYKTKQGEIRSAGIHCIVLWEDQWIKGKAIVKSRLCALLGISQRIPARLTVVERIDKQTASHFLETNHLQGSVSSKTRYGLYLPESYYRVLNSAEIVRPESPKFLVAVATFSHARIFQKQGLQHRSVELVRFCNLLHTTVVGGFSKLMQAMVDDFGPDDIMTYADLDWTDGEGYRRLGFTAISDAPPVRFWLDPGSLARFSEREIDGKTDHKILVCNLGSRKFVRLTPRSAKPI